MPTHQSLRTHPRESIEAQLAHGARVPFTLGRFRVSMQRLIQRKHISSRTLDRHRRHLISQHPRPTHPPPRPTPLRTSLSLSRIHSDQRPSNITAQLPRSLPRSPRQHLILHRHRHLPRRIRQPISDHPPTPSIDPPPSQRLTRIHQMSTPRPAPPHQIPTLPPRPPQPHRQLLRRSTPLLRIHRSNPTGVGINTLDRQRRRIHRRPLRKHPRRLRPHRLRTRRDPVRRSNRLHQRPIPDRVQIQRQQPLQQRTTSTHPHQLLIHAQTLELSQQPSHHPHSTTPPGAPITGALREDIDVAAHRTSVLFRTPVR